MRVPDSRWLKAINEVQWWILAGFSAGCWIMVGFHACEFLTLPSNAYWTVSLVGTLSSCLLIFRTVDTMHKSLKHRLCKFSKLTKQQQEFLIGVVRSGNRSIDTERFFSMNWFQELEDLGYIEDVGVAFVAYVTRQGWKRVEDHMKQSSPDRR